MRPRSRASLRKLGHKQSLYLGPTLLMHILEQDHFRTQTCLLPSQTLSVCISTQAYKRIVGHDLIGAHGKANLPRRLFDHIKGRCPLGSRSGRSRWTRNKGTILPIKFRLHRPCRSCISCVDRGIWTHTRNRMLCFISSIVT